MHQSITLNIPINSPANDWDTIANIYPTLDGWMPETEWPCWYGQEEEVSHIIVSAEPSGLIFSGEVEPSLWVGWVSVLCAKLSLALGREVHDAEK